MFLPKLRRNTLAMTPSHLRSTLNIQKPVGVLIFSLSLPVVIFVQIFEFYLVTPGRCYFVKLLNQAYLPFLV
jgi:hypothetical protein